MVHGKGCHNSNIYGHKTRNKVTKSNNRVLATEIIVHPYYYSADNRSIQNSKSRENGYSKITNESRS